MTRKTVETVEDNKKEKLIDEGMILINSLFSSIQVMARGYEDVERFVDDTDSLCTIGIGLVDVVRRVIDEK